jgi:hypothetical protein
MTDLVNSEAFDARVDEMLDLVQPEHRDAFRWVFDLGRGIMDKQGAEHMGLITALAINDSVRRKAADDAKKSKLLRV